MLVSQIVHVLVSQIVPMAPMVGVIQLGLGLGSAIKIVVEVVSLDEGWDKGGGGRW